MGVYSDYRRSVEYAFEGLEPDFLLAGALFLASLSLTYAGLFFDLMLGGLLAVLFFDAAIGYPLYLRQKRITEMEAMFPDVLTHMSTTLRAGGTIETALKEVSRANYGPITQEFKRMMREIKEGKTFDDALLDLGRRTESRNIERSINVIVSAKRTGGGLVQALSSISDDMRENARLFKERSAKTMTQVLFIIIAANFVGPFIFGLVSGIILFLASIGGGEAPPLFGTLIFYFKGYLLLSAVFSALAASMIREGNVTKTVIYAPVLLIITYTIFLGVSMFAGTFFGVG